MLKTLRLRDFRCLENLGLELHPRMNVFSGRNAQGKTSILEAICVLMRLQSPRSSDKKEWIRFDAGSCLIEGLLGETTLRYTQTETARRLAVQGTACSRMDAYMPHTALIVWMDHADMNLTRGSGEHRRRFLDFAAAQVFPEYRESLRAYERVLRSRNFLLKRDVVISWKQVDAYAAVMTRHADVLRRCRADLTDAMRADAHSVQAELSGGDEGLEVRFAPGFSSSDLGEELKTLRAEEERQRSTAIGPHRDDLEFTINGRDAASFGSEGQQRTLSVAMKVAQSRVLKERMGRAPLLLVDDVFGELDRHRRQAFLRALPQDSQIFITTTSMDWLDEGTFDGRIWEVRAGKVELKAPPPVSPPPLQSAHAE